MVKLIAAVLAAAAVALAPTAHADPVGDGPGPMADTVCRTLDNDPSVAGVRVMMRNFTGFMLFQPVAWDAILNGVVWNCPQHADLLRQYAAFYGNH